MLFSHVLHESCLVKGEMCFHSVNVCLNVMDHEERRVGVGVYVVPLYGKMKRGESS